MDIIVVT
ncbi:hypothetical protein YPPY05_2223, partial [Yersinia pestis PY-05]